jgi:streptopain
MAQVMRYYGHPSSMFNFGIMPPSLPTNNCNPDAGGQAIATLMKSAGLSVGMNYGASESGASTSDVPFALKTFFGYSSDIEYISLNPVGINRVADEIKYQSRVSIFRGQNGSAGHAWVVDGYKRFIYYDYATGNYISYLPYWSMNWGWGGASNGWYRSDD